MARDDCARLLGGDYVRSVVPGPSGLCLFRLTEWSANNLRPWLS